MALIIMQALPWAGVSWRDSARWSVAHGDGTVPSRLRRLRPFLRHGAERETSSGLLCFSDDLWIIICIKTSAVEVMNGFAFKVWVSTCQGFPWCWLV